MTLNLTLSVVLFFVLLEAENDIIIILHFFYTCAYALYGFLCAYQGNLRGEWGLFFTPVLTLWR